MLRDYHLSVAKGGVGMTTLAYAGICRSALSFKTQLWLRPEIVTPLREITDGIHSHGAKASIQIGHCGNMTHRSTVGATPVGASSGFNLYSPTIVRGLRKDEPEGYGTLFRRCRAHRTRCRIRLRGGACRARIPHLPVPLPYTNRRKDEYGGTLRQRMRFMQECMEEVMKAAGSDMGVIVKTNMRGGFKGDWRLMNVLKWQENYRISVRTPSCSPAVLSARLQCTSCVGRCRYTP